MGSMAGADGTLREGTLRTFVPTLLSEPQLLDESYRLSRLSYRTMDELLEE